MSIYYLNCCQGASTLVWQICVQAASIAQALIIANANGFMVLSIARVAPTKPPALSE